MAGQTRHDEAMRVILVGRTGLDQALRLEPLVELVRARTALDAIGELAQPLDDDSPAQSVIVVGDDGEPGDGAGAQDFVAAARDVDPTVRIVRVGAAGIGRVPYDGYVTPAADINTLKRSFAVLHDGDEHAQTVVPASGVESLISSILRNGRDRLEGGKSEGARAGEKGEQRRNGQVGARAGVGTGVGAGAQGGVREDVRSPGVAQSDQLPTSCGHGASGDRHVVEAMVRGGDVVAAALDVLRVRLGTPDVRFVALEPGASGNDHGVLREDVMWGEARLGVLEVQLGSAEESTEGQLQVAMAEHARWLAGWLRLRDQQGELRHAAFTDPLTGAWNRRYFDRFLKSVIEQCRATRRNLTLMVFDIDDFKVYNDRYGHAAGDEILTETVRLMRSVVRPTDRVCRIGGDEFGVIFYEPDGPREANSRHPDSVCNIAQRFQDQIARHCFPKLGTEAPGTLTVSGGLATYPWDGTTAEELLERADELALESKRVGKNVLMMGPRALRRNE